MEMFFKKLEALQIDVVWLVLAFIGIIFAIGSRQIESVTRWKVVQTFCAGMVCGVTAPVIVRDVLGYDSTALLAVSALVSSFFGMKIVAVFLSLDLQAVFEKRFGGGSK